MEQHTSLPPPFRTCSAVSSMLLSCVVVAIMGGMVNAALWREAQTSPLVVSFAHIVMNVKVLLFGLRLPRVRLSNRDKDA